MTPTLWRTCRVIANDMRINLLRILHKHGETPVTELGNLAEISEPHASLHLRLLNSRGLITARFSGKWVYYSPDANEAVQHAPQILDALKESFACSPSNNVHIYDAATSFTHRRRIMIVRHLKHGALSGRELSSRTNIPMPSMHRHLNKLVNRHIIEAELRRYSLCSPFHPLARTLVSIAQSE